MITKTEGARWSAAVCQARNGKDLYVRKKPAWFGDLDWPPFDPDTDFEKNKIPAHVRFEAMKAADGAPGRKSRR